MVLVFSGLVTLSERAGIFSFPFFSRGHGRAGKI
jgi:hypothetical protein